jgi:hypothetical protein
VNACSEWNGSGATYFSFSYGDAGFFQKVTVQVMDEKGHVAAYLKIAGNGKARVKIGNEAKVLSTLNADTRYCRYVPKLYRCGILEGNSLLAQSALKGHNGPAKLYSLQLSFLSNLIGEDHASIKTLPFWQQTKQRVLSCPQLAVYWNSIEKTLSESLVPKTIMHGDFAPWNVLVGRNRLTVFDWECAEMEGVPAFDAFHYALQYGFLVKRWSTQKAFKKLERLFRSADFYRYVNRTLLIPKQLYSLLRLYLLYKLSGEDERQFHDLQCRRFALLRILDKVST